MPGLQDAIAEAREQLTEEAKRVGAKVSTTEEQPEETEEETSEETTEEETEGETTETEEETDGLSDAEVLESRRLYKLLKDPQQGPTVLAALAQRAGLLNNLGTQTKQEVKETTKSILETLEESLGPTYKFLAPGLAKGLETVLQQERKTQLEAVSEVRIQQTLGEVDKALSSLAKETNGASRQFENKMADLIEKYPMPSNGNVDEYMRDMYNMASAGKTKQTIQKGVADKVRRNANNVADRLGQRGSSSQGTDSVPQRKMSLNESIAWAVAQSEKQGKKK